MNVSCSIDAEWIMEKKHWRQSVRQERTGSSPTGSRGVDTDDANAYLPEMDEMRCLLWAHGGSFHVAFLLPFYVNFKVGIISGAWIRRGEEHFIGCQIEDSIPAVYRYMIQRYARKIRGRVLGN
jgi:hypothetical protein